MGQSPVASAHLQRRPGRQDLEIDDPCILERLDERCVRRARVEWVHGVQPPGPPLPGSPGYVSASAPGPRAPGNADTSAAPPANPNLPVAPADAPGAAGTFGEGPDVNTGSGTPIDVGAGGSENADRARSRASSRRG